MKKLLIKSSVNDEFTERDVTVDDIVHSGSFVLLKAKCSAVQCYPIDGTICGKNVNKTMKGSFFLHPAFLFFGSKLGEVFAVGQDHTPEKVDFSVNEDRSFIENWHQRRPVNGKMLFRGWDLTNIVIPSLRSKGRTTTWIRGTRVMRTPEPVYFDGDNIIDPPIDDIESYPDCTDEIDKVLGADEFCSTVLSGASAHELLGVRRLFNYLSKTVSKEPRKGNTIPILDPASYTDADCYENRMVKAAELALSPNQEWKAWEICNEINAQDSSAYLHSLELVDELYSSDSLAKALDGACKYAMAYPMGSTTQIIYPACFERFVMDELRYLRLSYKGACTAMSSLDGRYPGYTVFIYFKGDVDGTRLPLDLAYYLKGRDGFYEPLPYSECRSPFELYYTGSKVDERGVWLSQEGNCLFTTFGLKKEEK